MLTQMQNELLGAMIGLVRAAEKNGKTADTENILFEGVDAVRNGAVSEELLLRVREEKNKAAPGCALCAMPCGSTADADMAAVWQGEARSVALKKEILQQVFSLKEVLSREAGKAEEGIYLLHKGLFFVGEYAAPDELENVLTELKTYIENHMR